MSPAPSGCSGRSKGPACWRAGDERSGPRGPRGLQVVRLLDHSEIDPLRPVGLLSVGARQVVEIARALVSDARVLILDEPTSSLAGHDVSRLFEVIRRLRSGGMAIVYISHFLEEVREIA